MTRTRAYFQAILLLAVSLFLIQPAAADVRSKTRILQDSIAETADGTVIGLDEYTSVGVQVTISDTAEVTFEVSEDYGIAASPTWASKACVATGDTGGSLVTSTTGTGTYQCNVAGMVAFRARVSSHTGGTVDVTATATQAVSAGAGGGGGGGGGGTQYAEDAAHSSGNIGTMALVVRSDAGNPLCGSDGDYCPLQIDGNGALRVTGGGGGTEYTVNAVVPANPVGTATLMERDDALSALSEVEGDWTNLRSNANGALWVIDENSAAQTTALQLIDNLVLAEDSAHSSTDPGVAMLCVRHDTATTGLGADGDYANCGMSAAGRIYVDALVSDGSGALNVIVDSGTITAVTTITNPVTVTDGSGALNVIVDSLPTVTVTDGAGALNVIVDSGTITTVSTVSSVSAVIPGTGATNLGKAEDSAHSSTDTGVMTLGVRNDGGTVSCGADGDYCPFSLDSNGALRVTGGGGGTEYTEDVATPAAIVGHAVMMERDDALSTLTPIEGDWASLRSTSIGSLWVRDDNGNVTDAAAGASDRGMPALVIRDDALTTLTPSDGDYTHLRVDSTGALHVAIASIAATAASATVTEDGSIPADATGVSETAAVLYCDNGTNPVHCDYTTAGGLKVNVAASIPGTGATNLGKAVDSAAGATDTGVAILAVRDDSLSSLTPAEGDYVHLRVSSTGALHVTGGGGGTQYNIGDVASATATGTVLLAFRDDSLSTLADAEGDYVGLRVNSTGALHVTGGGGGTEYVVNDAADANPTGATFVMERDDALSTLTEAEGDWTNPRATAEGALWTQDFNSDAILAALATISGAVSGTEMQVDVLTLIPGTGATSLGKAEDAAHSSGDTGVAVWGIRDDTLGAFSGAEGDYEPFHMTAAGRLYTSATIDAAIPAGNNNIGDVDIASIAAGDNNIGNVDIVTMPNVTIGTFPDNEPFNVAQYGGTAVVTGGTNGLVGVGGNVAHDAVDAANPVKIGGRAIAHGSNPTAVAAADRTDWYFSRAGVPFVMGGHPNVVTISAQVQDADGAQTDQAIASVTAGSKIVVTRLTASCDGSTTAPTNIRVGFGAANVPAAAHTGVAGILHEFDGVPAGGGFTVGDGSGILGVGADGEDLRYTMEDPAGGNCTVTASYYTIES